MKGPANRCHSCGADDATKCDCTSDAKSAEFTGTENPRELRAIDALTRRPMPREHLDRAAGCCNGPDLVSRLRQKGLVLPCDRVPIIDRDGVEVLRGVYHLTHCDRRKIQKWLVRRGRK